MGELLILDAINAVIVIIGMVVFFKKPFMKEYDKRADIKPFLAIIGLICVVLISAASVFLIFDKAKIEDHTTTFILSISVNLLCLSLVLWGKNVCVVIADGHLYKRNIFGKVTKYELGKIYFRQEPYNGKRMLTVYNKFTNAKIASINEHSVKNYEKFRVGLKIKKD